VNARFGKLTLEVGDNKLGIIWPRLIRGHLNSNLSPSRRSKFLEGGVDPSHGELPSDRELFCSFDLDRIEVEREEALHLWLLGAFSTLWQFCSSAKNLCRPVCLQAQKQMNIQQMDLQTAFLHGDLSEILHSVLDSNLKSALSSILRLAELLS
jgi:hypothetical protein